MIHLQLALTDAALLSSYCDATLLVVATNETPIKLTKKKKEALENVNANVIGSVMTKLSINAKEYQYYDVVEEVSKRKNSGREVNEDYNYNATSRSSCHYFKA